MAEAEIVNDTTRDKEADMQVAISRALTAVGLQAQSYARVEITKDPERVDTGRLRASISSAVNGNDVYIGTNVEYAIYVHEGTSKMAPNRFLRNAAVNYKDAYQAIFQHFIDEALK